MVAIHDIGATCLPRSAASTTTTARRPGAALVFVLECWVVGTVQIDHVLNIAFFVFHTTWIAFNCLGWMSKRTRPWQLVTVSLTALSWFGLGVHYGWGYCPCTDWHWQVRARLGFHDPPSYVQLLIREATGIDIGSEPADALAMVTLAFAAVLGVVLTIRDRQRLIHRGN